LPGCRTLTAQKTVVNPLRQIGTVDHKTHLGVQHGRARVKIKRSDKDLFTVDTECLGMQTGARIPGQPTIMDRVCLITGWLKFIQFYSVAKQLFAPARIARMNH
jgi:hypothetical protein